MHYQVKISSKNQITLPVNLLKNIKAKSGDVLSMSVTPSGVSLNSMTAIKQKARDHLSVINPYNISKEIIKKINLKGVYGEAAVRRYERFLNQNKAK
jgi:bifunctional DNA-binding transcriptional regulator/antitoxin component of YhaV-PrlF toxin-antitoxin module